MDEITIRPARPADAAAIASLDVETWQSTYAGLLANSYLVGLSPQRRERGWAHVIAREPCDVRVALGADGSVRGFGSCGATRDEPGFAGEVFTLYVGPDWQNSGIGRRLLLALFARLVETGRNSAIVWVLHANPGRFFYKRLGGRQVGRKSFTLGGDVIEAESYGWPDLAAFLATPAGQTPK